MHIKSYSDGSVTVVTEQDPYNMGAVEKPVPQASYINESVEFDPRAQTSQRSFNDEKRKESYLTLQKALDVSRGLHQLRSAERDIARQNVLNMQMSGHSKKERAKLNLVEEAYLQDEAEKSSMSGFGSMAKYNVDFNQLEVIPLPAQSIYRDHVAPTGPRDWELYECASGIYKKGSVPEVVEVTNYPTMGAMNGLFDDLQDSLEKEADKLTESASSELDSYISQAGDSLTCSVLNQNCPPEQTSTTTRTSTTAPTSTQAGGMSPDMQKYLMYGGAAVLGLGVLAVIMRAVR